MGAYLPGWLVEDISASHEIFDSSYNFGYGDSWFRSRTPRFPVKSDKPFYIWVIVLQIYVDNY
jgi:hypothetical protein